MLLLMCLLQSNDVKVFQQDISPMKLKKNNVLLIPVYILQSRLTQTFYVALQEFKIWDADSERCVIIFIKFC